VYRRADLALERDVAIKVLTRRSPLIPGVERFRREAQLAARSAIPTSVSVLDIYGPRRPDLVYDGIRPDRTSRRWCSAWTFSLEQTERLLNERLSALNYPQRSLIHRT